MPSRAGSCRLATTPVRARSAAVRSACAVERGWGGTTRIVELARQSSPADPVAVMVSFYAFVRDALLAMAGATPEPLPTVHATTTAALRKKPGRTEYQRGLLARAENAG